MPGTFDFSGVSPALIRDVMKQVTIFRLMIVVGFCLAITGAFLDMVVPGIVPPVLEDAYDAYSAEEPEPAHLLLLGVLLLLVFIAGLASTIGLFFLKPWSRRVALWVTVLAVVIYPFFGASVCSGWASMLIDSSSMLWGAVLAMAFFSELKVHFEK